jgi:mono/diheme cytochrome c family protein
MQDQPKYKPLAESQFFADHRSARPQVEGTVARGHLRIDPARYTGKINNNDIDYFPIPITKDDMLRGQQRFNVYCTPCHSRLGDGQGMVVRRGYRSPPSYFTPKLIDAPVGHFFDVMTNGFGAMPSYASRVAPDDRWRIAAYIRALQYSMSGAVKDVPTAYLQEHPLEPLPFGPKLTTAPPANPATMQGVVPEGPPAPGAPIATPPAKGGSPTPSTTVPRPEGAKQ